MIDNSYTELPSYLEKVQAQLPALQLLIQMGWKYLTPEECVEQRNSRMGTAILEPILTEHIRNHARYEFKGCEREFTENAIQNAVQALKGFRATGASHEDEQSYDLLCLGTSVPQTIEGDTKSFTIDYIDWKNPANNSYHCTAEYKVERVGYQKHYIPDIVLFVNGIPVVVIECKRSAYTDLKKEPIDLAIGDLKDYQAKDGIPQLFLYTQLVLALARDKAEYATTGTPRKFWSVWREGGLDDEVRTRIEKPMPGDTLDRLLTGPFELVGKEFRSILAQGRAVYEQDRLVYGLCRPERLLEIVYKFVVFDHGDKKVARYQQYFTVQDIMARVRAGDGNEARRGGVVWHTQGSGKSLTMVMLAKSLALAKDILNPKVVIVTDRIDLDDQIKNTFHACGMLPDQAATGETLVDLLADEKAHIVTTTIHKFGAAAGNRRLKGASRNTFVLVDEGHRSNYSEYHTRMKIALKGACFIAFTGTPLAKNAKRNTFAKFGDLFQPAYTIARAVEDKAVVPLVYEARHVPQPVDQGAIDSWFEKLTIGLSEEQQVDLKKKFSSERQLMKAAQRIKMIAWDVSVHYSTTYQGLGMKGQLVAPDKESALLYKKFLDEFGMVKSEVLISAPAVREGESENEASEEEKVFWEAMMDRYGSEDRYNKQLISAFKNGEEPEIIIVVDKLLTGFDAPCNTVLYLARKLKDHTLLQAIARVNRLFEGKEYGLILDYSGVIDELDEAIGFYDKLADYDREDIIETVTYVENEAARLPQLHSDLWELFTPVRGAKDPEAYEEHLRDVELRNRFYERFSLFARTLSLALSSTVFIEKTPRKTLDRYKQDVKFFQNLRAAVSLRYQERVDFSEYEQKIRKLLDTHVGAEDVVKLSEPINLFDSEERQKVLDDQGRSAKSKADLIASATSRAIEREMEKDPAFYKKFSKMLEDVLEAMRAKRIEALEALGKIVDIATKVVTHTDDDTPSLLAGKDMARRYYGCIQGDLAEAVGMDQGTAAEIALAIVDRIAAHQIRDWRDNHDALNKMRGEIDDILFELAHEKGMSIPLEVQDRLIDRCVEVAVANEDIR